MSDQTPRRGNFDQLRLIAAFLVLFSHAFLLSAPQGSRNGWDPLQAFEGGGYSLGTLGVDIFFVISGYLVTQSWVNDIRLAPFAVKRALRIVPALVVAVLATTFLFGPFLADQGPITYLTNPTTWSYLINSLIFPQQEGIPGVFTRNQWGSEINGSLWTLRYEASAYLLVPLSAIWGRSCGRATSLVLWVALVSLLTYIPNGSGLPLFANLDGALLVDLFSFFFGGMTLFYWRNMIPLRGWIAGLLLLVCALGWLSPLRAPLAAVAVPYCMIYLATGIPTFANSLVKVDISYGVYLYAFVVEQAVAQVLGAHASPLLIIALALPPTIVFAFLSRKLIENPALSLKRRLQRPKPSVGPQVV